MGFSELKAAWSRIITVFVILVNTFLLLILSMTIFFFLWILFVVYSFYCFICHPFSLLLILSVANSFIENSFYSKFIHWKFFLLQIHFIANSFCCHFCLLLILRRFSRPRRPQTDLQPLLSFSIVNSRQMSIVYRFLFSYLSFSFHDFHLWLR